MTIQTVPDDITAHTVTRFDNLYEREEPPDAPGGVLHFYFPLTYGRSAAVLPLDLPPRWTRERDFILASTVDHNTMWAGAVAWAISRVAALDWSVNDTSGDEDRAERARQLLLQANLGQGWITFLTQHLSDYLLTDNGAFTEVIWSTLRMRRDERGRIVPVGRVLGIQHLDSVRCTRLDDTDLGPYQDSIAAYWGILPREVHSRNFPVIYNDLAGRPHLLWRWQCGHVSDMTSPRAELRGTGQSAASRAYHAIVKDANLERYVSEKIVGHSPKEIHLVSGIMAKQFEDATAASLDQSRSSGRQVYRGVVVIPGIKPDAAVSGYRIPIAEIPDGFDAEQERTNSYNKYAVNLGIPKRDLQPAPSGLNSGQTAAIEAEQADGTGLARWLKWFNHWINSAVLPSSTGFEWTGDSVTDQKAKAEVMKLRAEARAVMITSQEITASQALQMAVDAEDAPPEFLPEDGTPQDTLRDDEKPMEGAPGVVTPAPALEAPQKPAQTATAAAPTINDVLRNKSDAPDAIDSTWDEAMMWARLALQGGKE